MKSMVFVVRCRESIVLVQFFFSDQIMFWSFEFFGRYWLLHIILILKSMKSMVFVVHCRESIVLIQNFFCDQIMFWSFDFFGRYWLLHIILILKSMKSIIFVVRCYFEPFVVEKQSFWSIFSCDQIMFWSFEFFGRNWLLHIILIL